MDKKLTMNALKQYPLPARWLKEIWLPKAPRRSKSWTAAGLMVLHPELDSPAIAALAGASSASVDVWRTAQSFVLLIRQAYESFAEFVIDSPEGFPPHLLWKLNPHAVEILLNRALSAADHCHVDQRPALLDIAANAALRLGLVAIRIGHAERILGEVRSKLKGEFTAPAAL